MDEHLVELEKKAEKAETEAMAAINEVLKESMQGKEQGKDSPTVVSPPYVPLPIASSYPSAIPVTPVPPGFSGALNPPPNFSGALNPPPSYSTMQLQPSPKIAESRDGSKGLGKPIPGVFRNLIELSIMINNDEQVYYSDKQIDWRETTEKLRFSRPVWEEEKLDHKFRGPPDRERTSDLTKVLDAIFLIKSDLEDHVVRNPSESLATLLAYQYYDCMSGGCPYWVLRIVWEVCQDPRVNKLQEVYPGKEDGGWYTIQDFIDDFAKKAKARPMMLPLRDILLLTLGEKNDPL